MSRLPPSIPRGETTWQPRCAHLSADGTTIVIATHDAPFAEACIDRVLLLHDGRIVREGRAGGRAVIESFALHADAGAHRHARRAFIERDTERKIRHRNKLYYRFNHWPIWIFVFFIAPGPLTFDLFERGFDRADADLAGRGAGRAPRIAGLRGRLPGCEPAPYIIRFTEDRPNPLYRRVCYTTAWGEVVAFAVLNIAGLAYAPSPANGA